MKRQVLYSDYVNLATDALKNLKSFKDRLLHAIRIYKKTIKEEQQSLQYTDDVRELKDIINKLCRLQNGFFVDFEKIIADYDLENDRLSAQAKIFGLDEKNFNDLILMFLVDVLSRRR